MTVKILGHWEIGYHAPITEQYDWAFALREFKMTDWNMSPVSGIRNREREVNLTEWNRYDDFFEAYPDLKRVFFEARTKHENPDTIWLDEYEHPENCVYVFGAANFNPTKLYAREQDDIVSIRTPASKGLLWADQAMPIVLYERSKQWQ